MTANMLRAIIFLVGSAGLVVLSWRAAGGAYSHGFPRFFAFEAILALVVLNAPFWLVQPFSLKQIVSWALLLASAFLALHAIWALRHFGKPDPSLRDSGRLAFEKTTRLVTQGPYHFIRHPLYASLLLLAWGVFLKQVNLTTALLAIMASLTLYLTAAYEERENLRTFGDEYTVYMHRTKRFIPFVF